MKKIYIGIDVGATFAKVSILDEKIGIVARDKVSSAGFSDKRFFLKNIKAVVSRLLSQKKLSFKNVLGIGVGVPGPVDTNRGLVLSLTNIKGWDNFGLSQYLKKSFSVPIFVDNDANCMALAESRLGAAKGFKNALCLTLGTGVGSGVIINGGLYRGPYFLGGELGHIPLTNKGPKCACGGTGCLERFVGNKEILKIVRHKFGHDMVLEEVSKLSEKGNAKAQAVWKEVGSYLGLALAGVVNFINPEVIVIGGGVSGAGEALFSEVRRVIKSHAMKQLKSKIKVKRAALGNDAGFLGAGLLVKESIGADA